MTQENLPALTVRPLGRAGRFPHQVWFRLDFERVVTLRLLSLDLPALGLIFDTDPTSPAAPVVVTNKIDGTTLATADGLKIAGVRFYLALDLKTDEDLPVTMRIGVTVSAGRYANAFTPLLPG